MKVSVYTYGSVLLSQYVIYINAGREKVDRSVFNADVQPQDGNGKIFTTRCKRLAHGTCDV